ncbi:conserved hypothetical protein [Rippkaea orientalis PCC 8801]|uniref:Orc1-like AAA ATPase domain-containing protein n=1 Tax=Rippkaea orientalis (strain PCC 8801 / RF-1) TaxID=41431 RepID=B7JXM5_RIPO1|nr:P-loop NTPase fold protein [Rippkaea orientalis]ACK64782.1 conserved hypothetical protein [Rippkaea orientalis PCC 8801]
MVLDIKFFLILFNISYPMAQDPNLLKTLFNAFNPFQPLKADDPAYVNCQEVRGDGDIITELGKEITYSDHPSCQLYAGHTGAGKSTELKRLEKYLKEQKFYVVYFAADEEDIDPEDAQHTDILLACTRHLLEDLKDKSNAETLVDWLKNLGQVIQDLALTEISINDPKVEVGITQFAKLSAVLKAAPGSRQQIRQQIENHTPSLIEALNKFINEAKQTLSKDKYKGIVVIADNLDRIARKFYDNGQRSNHDSIFIDRSEQLRKLDCHTIYTVPLSMVYSDRATILEDKFGTIRVLPMIMVRTSDNNEYEPGIKKVIQLIEKRIKKVDSNLQLDKVFQDTDDLKLLCLMSGGHVRNLMLLMNIAIQKTSELPITQKAIKRAISDLRKTYRNGINEDEWQILAKVHLSKKKPNNIEHQKLLANRSILEYHSIENDDIKPWYDIHPVIKDIEEFDLALQQEQKLREDRENE